MIDKAKFISKTNEEEEKLEIKTDTNIEEDKTLLKNEGQVP